MEEIFQFRRSPPPLLQQATGGSDGRGRNDILVVVIMVIVFTITAKILMISSKCKNSAFEQKMSKIYPF